MHASAPDPRNPHDQRWVPPEAPPNVTVVTVHRHDGSVVVYEPGVGKPEPCLETDTWYRLDACD